MTYLTYNKTYESYGAYNNGFLKPAARMILNPEP